MTKDSLRRLGVVLAGAYSAIWPAEGFAAQANATFLAPPKAQADDRLVIAKKDPKPQDDTKAEPKVEDAKKAGKPLQVGTYGDWGAFVAQGGQGGKDKTCYALAQPKDRAPAALKRDPAYVFISSRPGENVRNEVSIIMGFPLKESGESRAEVAGSNFDLVVKGTNAWIKNLADETRFIEALKKGSKLVVRAPSAKGNVTTDSYSLSGLSQALEKVQKECP